VSDAVEAMLVSRPPSNRTSTDARPDGRLRHPGNGGILMSARPQVPAGLHTVSPRLPVEGELRSFSGATEWLNTPPLTETALRGKVVLVNFWTYTCINWLRQLPYLRAGTRSTRTKGS
jgi:hypothetical protein